jgi:YD repeat-containing protein
MRRSLISFAKLFVRVLVVSCTVLLASTMMTNHRAIAQSGPTPNFLSCPTYGTLGNQLFLPDLAPALASADGTIPGDFEVSDTGAATYSMTLDLPPGRAGMEPKLGIEYDSDSGNGPLGVGFSLTGLSSITYCPRTYRHDGELQSLQFQGGGDHYDPLCLDGLRLVMVGNGTTYNMPGDEYRTFPDTATKVVQYGSGYPWGLKWFRVWTKDGRISDYRPSFHLSSSDGNPQSFPSGYVSTWTRQHVADRNGNYMTFHYTDETNAAGETQRSYISSIDYTSHVDAAHVEDLDASWNPPPPDLQPRRLIEFGYEDRADPISGYALGSLVSTPQRINEVRVFGPPIDPASPGFLLIRRYYLRYQDTNTVSGRSRLTSVQECVPTGPGALNEVCRRPTTFKRVDPGSNALSPGFVPSNTNLGFSAGLPSAGRVLMTGDVDGDGREEIIYKTFISADDWAFSRASAPPNSTGSYTWTTTAFHLGDTGDNTSNVVPIDYNQDGRTDLLITRGAANYRVMLANGPSSVPGYSTAPIDTGIPVATPANTHFVDFNGDGAPDLVTCRTNIGYEVRLWQQAPSPGFSGTPFTIGGGYACTEGLVSFMSLDANGDGAGDILLRNPAESQSNFLLLLYSASDPNHFVSFDSGVSGSASLQSYRTIDVNGDGLDDLLYLDPALSMTIRINRGGWFPGRDPIGFSTATSGPVLGNPSQLSSAVQVDINADGRDDLLIPGVGAFEGTNTTYLSTGSNFSLGTGIGAKSSPQRIALDGNPNAAIVSVDRTHLPSPVITLALNQALNPDLVVSITDGLTANSGDDGVDPSVSGITYRPLVHTADNQHWDDLYHKNDQGDCSFPVRCVVGTKLVVSSYNKSTGIAVIEDPPDNFNSYPQQQLHRLTYRDARFDLWGEGWLGFAERTDFLRRGFGAIGLDVSHRVTIDNQTYDPDRKTFPNVSLHQSDETIVGNLDGSTCGASGTTRRFHTYGDPYSANPSAVGATYFVYADNERTFFAESAPCHGTGQDANPTTATDTVIELDQYANLLSSSSTTTGGSHLSTLVYTSGPQRYSSIGWANEQHRDTDTCSSEPSQEQQCVWRTATFDPQTGMPLTSVLHGDVWHNFSDTNLLTTFYQPDSYGNVVASDSYGASDDVGNYQHRSSCTSYESNEFIFPFFTNRGGSSGSTASIVLGTAEKYDPRLGVRTHSFDANGYQTRWGYDGFGHLQQESRPDGTSTTYTRSIIHDGSFFSTIGSTSWILSASTSLRVGIRFIFSAPSRAVQLMRSLSTPSGDPYRASAT